jgi:hypothetical protein
MPISDSKKCKIEGECCVFQKKWVWQYFAHQINSNNVCLVCNQTISVCRDYNIKHHNNIHKEKYDLFVGKIREDKLNKLKSGLNKQQNIFQSLSKVNETAVKAIYALSHLITSNSKPFTNGQFIKECLIETAKIVCPNKLKDFQSISLT